MSKKPQKRRIRNPTQTRTKLLQATIQLLAEKGVDALSLKEAARVANVSRGAAYQHFENRDHLLTEAKNWVSDQLSDTVVDDSAASMDERVNHVAKLILNNPDASRLLIADALAGKDLDANHPLHKLLLEILAEFKAIGDARDDIDVEIMSFIMLGTISTLIMLSRLCEQGDIDEVARRFTTEWTGILRYGIYKEGQIPE